MFASIITSLVLATSGFAIDNPEPQSGDTEQAEPIIVREDGFVLSHEANQLLDLLDAQQTYTQPRLSPDGTKLAYAHRLPNGDGGVFVLTVIDLDSEGASAARSTPLGELPPRWIRWATNDRILVAHAFRVQFRGRLRIQSDQFPPMVRTLSLDASFSEPATVLFSDELRRNNWANWSLSNVVDYLPDDPDHILMPARTGTGRLNLWRVNILTGETEVEERGNRDTRSWYTVDGVAVMRMDVRRGGRLIIHSRPDANSRWRRTLSLRRRDVEEQRREVDFEWAGQTSEPGIIYVRAQRNESDFIGIHRYDLATGEFLETIAERGDYDIDYAMVNNFTGEYYGYGYTADRPLYFFENEDFNAHYTGLVNFFGDQVRVEPYSFGGDRMIVRVGGPTELGSFYLYDFEASSVEPLFAIWPEALETQTFPVETMRYIASDGLEIEGFVTWPEQGEGPATPLIVLPHGGPESRDFVGFDEVPQFLATLGYAVFQPNFRGSYGYGRAFTQAGHRNWATSMQSDITDGVHRLIGDGRVDADRICIAGFSYGGYAALTSSAQHPELYRCTIAGGAVTDMEDFLRFKEDRHGDSAREYWVEQFGDPDIEADRQAMQAQSPVNMAGQLRSPILLLHGSEDTLVPVEQSRDMAGALAAAGIPHVYIEEDGGYHNWGTDIDNFRMNMRNVAAFLEDAMDGSIDSFVPEIPVFDPDAPED